MFGLFRKHETDEQKHETDEQIKERLLKLCHKGDYGVCPAPMDADVAINELRDFFLGKDWYSSFATGSKPTLAEVIYQIEARYKPKKAVRNKQLTDTNSAISELQDFFLGKDWYVSIPISHKQVIAESVYQIETRYKIYKAK